MRSDVSPSPPLAQSRRHPLIRLLTSIWFGVALLTLILIYGSLVSALAPVRWTLEMTEMQAFRHWLLVTLVVLFALALLAATFLRTRWTAVNAGALTAHLGLLLLTGGAFVYFGSKIEGDVLLQAPAILVRATLDGRTSLIGHFPAERDKTWSRSLPHLGQALKLRVLETQGSGVQPVTAANVQIQLGESEPRTLTLTDAPNAWQTIQDTLAIRLETFPPQTSFYENETATLYIRNLATGTQLVRNIEHLPIYRDRYPTDEGVLHDTHGLPVASKRLRPVVRLLGLAIPTGWFEAWRLPVGVDTGDLPFSLQVTGYVPYVDDVRPTALPGGGVRMVPVLEAREDRRADIAPRAKSAIQLKIVGRGAQASWSQTLWCPFSMYADVDEHVLHFAVPGTNATWELVYSRARHDLGAALAARKLSVTYFPGHRGIDTFRSEIRVQEDDRSPRPATVCTKATENRDPRAGRWTLFQHSFDADEHWRYTILGVGNRVGMWPMNIGWIVITAGCLYAFYVKPVLLRRMKARE